MHAFVPRIVRGLVLVAASLGVVAPVEAQDSELSPTATMCRNMVGWVHASKADHGAFLTRHVSPELVERAGWDELVSTMAEIHGAIGRAFPKDISVDEPEAVLVFPGGEGDHRLHLLLDEHGEVADLWLEGGPGLDPTRDHAAPYRLAPITWETLEARLEEEAAGWFSGVVLVRRDGETVLRAAYGLADRERERAMRPDTIFAVGSVPIDFTRAAILLLIDRGELSWDDTLDTFFDDVPEDKAAITVGQLMQGESGFADFFERPEETNPDHTWIERDELVRRMFASELLFEPGTDREHSHGGYGLLAVILELVSGQSYQAFTREHLFAPAGMDDTGFFGEELPADRFAVGYGEASNGEVNAPPWWGPTSWLVMGSGGMVSTADDLLAFQAALRGGAILSPEVLGRYWAPPGAVASAGDMFGFELYYTEDPGQQVFVVSNATDMTTRPRLTELARALIHLVRSS